MKLDKKIIVILTFLTIIAISWWIFSSQQDNPLFICDPDSVGSEYNLSYCNVSCDIDDDCIFTCGCGAINKQETCHDGGIIYGCVDRYVYCSNKKCVAGEERTPIPESTTTIEELSEEEVRRTRGIN